MKRTLPFLLLALMMVSPIEAATASKKQNKHRKKKPASVEQLYQAEPGAAIPLLPRLKPEMSRMGIRPQSDGELVAAPGPVSAGPPTEGSMRRAGSVPLDLRLLPQTPPVRQDRPEREDPNVTPVPIEGGVVPPSRSLPAPTQNAPAPSPLASFLGLDFASWGAGRPPDTVGDVGPNHYIQAVNTSIGIFSKSGGAPLAAFSFNTFMAQGHFGNLCDTNNFGDPIILYDTFEDRWVITDFAFLLDGGGNVVNPPGSFQCIAVSRTGDPIAGGWNFYSLHITDLLNDYPKLGIWPDGIYMSANMFGFPASGTYQGTRVWALNKTQMYAGAPSIQVVQFNPPSSEFTLLPSNARLQAGTPPAGSPNYFSTIFNFTNAISTYEFHVDWNRISLSTFNGPFITIAPTSWIQPPATVPAKGGNNNDTLATRLMMQNQYTNLAGVESLWQSHTIRNPTTAGVSAVRYYQTAVTGGSVAANTTQAFTHAPDTTNRYMPSVAVDRAGNMALGYSASTSTLFPAIRYAGRLSTDPVNSLPQTETSLIEGTGSQNSSTRWGDYSAMSLDPDGCTFWFTNEYYAAIGSNWQTRIGSFSYGPPAGSSCTTVATGTVSGAVTASAGGTPIAGAAVSFGSRTATTDGSGFYSFLLVPSGTYPGSTVTAPGYNPSTATGIVVTDGNTTTQDFALSVAATSGCLVDTTQADFQTGTPTNTDFTTSPGDLTLLTTPDQQNTNLSSTGAGVDIVNWVGQTFTAGQSGQLARVDVSLFCFSCTGTSPNLTLSLRATSGNLPTGPDLATATLPGTNSGAPSYVTATFATPATVTAGTVYALVVRPVADPSAGTYALTISSTNPYANGQRVLSTDSGSTWAGAPTDLGFKTFVKTGFLTSGDFVSALKDANPASGMTPVWSTLSWTATIPANTSLKFQVAASNSAGGPFNFVGPDGTAATFFTTSGAPLSQFYGFRYLQYKAYLATTDTTQSPTLSDVTVCFAVVDCSAPITITPTPSQVCASSTGNTASGPGGAASYAWSISNGTIAGSATSQSVTYTAGASGSVGLMLSIVEAGGCHKSASTSVTIQATPTPTITPGGPTTFCNGGSVTLTSSSATGNQWYNGVTLLAGETNQTYVATASGNYNVVVTASGCASAHSASTVVTVNPIPPTPTVTPGGPATFCAGGSVTLTSSSATGNQWYNGVTLLAGQTNQSYVATATGNYNVAVTASGCASAPSSSTAVTVNPIPPTPTVTPGGPATFCAGGSVTLTSSSATGNQWYNGVTLLAGQTNQTYVATATGNYNVIVTNGCPSAPSASTAVTVNPIPATPTITPSGSVQFCSNGNKTLTSSSATGNQWYLEGTPIPGATNPTVSADNSGNYTVVVTTSGCSSAPSAATNVTVVTAPAKPVITAGGPSTFCAGGGVTLNTNSATGNQWYLNGNPIAGGTNQNYVATASGSYTATVNSLGCVSNLSDPTVVTVNPLPATPTITPGGPTMFCTGGSVTLTSSSSSGNQWYLNGNPIGGATNQTYSATASGNYTVRVTGGNSCTSAPSSAATVTVSPIPATPTITPGGPTTFCTGGSVNLTSSSATGNQWLLNGNPIGGATSQTYNASAAGNYTVTVTTTGCTSAPSAATTVAINPKPNATITAPVSVVSGSTGNAASVANAGAGSTYAWSLTGGTITAGAGTSSVTFTAGGPGTLTLNVTVAASNGCSDAKSANVAAVLPPVTVTSISPAIGTIVGGTPVTINGAGFVNGATVTVGGTAATNVVFVSSIKITTKTPAHPAGSVSVTVTNTDTSNGTLAAGYLYEAQVFDPNNDNKIDSLDIFFLVNFLFLGGPAPHGAGGMLSADANSDGIVNSSDIFYVVNYLFLGGLKPNSLVPRGTSAGAEGRQIAGSISLGKPVLRSGHSIVPVIMRANPGSIVPQAMSLRVHFDGEGTMGEATVRKAGVAKDVPAVFELSRRSGNDLSYLVSYDPRGLALGASRFAVVAEIELESVDAYGSLSIDPPLTMLANQAGTVTATVANGKLEVSGTTIGSGRLPRPRPPGRDMN